MQVLSSIKDNILAFEMPFAGMKGAVCAIARAWFYIYLQYYVNN